ncbi:signal protein [Streptomyces sp. NPDC090106]|uniref:signal protein n=1 Tax=Streptomyces sp. NPDC090106 TaxID=3365946 RepID=UPI0037FB2D7A
MKAEGVGAGLVVVVLAGLLAGCGRSASGGSEEAKDTAAGTVSSAGPVGLTPEVLQSRWWSWAGSEPEGTNPVADEDGDDCARNQPEDVWFLAGTFGTLAERGCTVPAGTPLAFPLVNRIGTPAECAAFMAEADGSAVLDGEEADAEVYRDSRITVRGVDGNPVTGSGGSFTATGCGIWVQLPAPAPGPHTLTIRGRAGDFSTGVDYTLTVTGA